MPELPEVETVVRQLRPHLKGGIVRKLEVYDERLALKKKDCAALAGARVAELRRRGKQVAIALDAKAGRRWLLIHLRMTGRCLWEPPGEPAGLRRVRAKLALEAGAMVFADVRRFGTIEIVGDLAERPLTGLDPLDRAFTPAKLGELIAGASTPLKTWLLRQDRLVGLGNIYASEICFESGLDPRRPAGELTRAKCERLHATIREVLRRAIRHCGTTFSDFQGSDGRIGRYQQYLKVYGCADAPCPACGKPVERIVQAQRSTFFCPRCQRG